MTDNAPWLQTFSGGKLHFLTPTPDEILIEDIAHGLSMKCRFSGQCIRFVSVAEHCVLLCENYGWGNEDAFALLMHDASEAYMGDVPTPMKRCLPDFQRIEDGLQAEIDAKFGVKYSEVVKNWDSRIVIDERAQNMRRTKYDWDFGDLTPLGIQLRYWSPAEAEARFLKNFHRLSRLVSRPAA